MIDESQRKFEPNELEIAKLLETEGKDVVALPVDNSLPGRFADSEVDGVRTEFKNPDPGADNGRIKNEVNNSLKRGGQARHIIINAKGKGLTLPEAQRAIARIRGISRGRLDSLRIIGDDFDITETNFP
jgi:Contact-dependent growth inhibition CdiA C-terminal domain